MSVRRECIWFSWSWSGYACFWEIVLSCNDRNWLCHMSIVHGKLYFSWFGTSKWPIILLDAKKWSLPVLDGRYQSKCNNFRSRKCIWNFVIKMFRHWFVWKCDSIPENITIHSDNKHSYQSFSSNHYLNLVAWDHSHYSMKFHRLTIST